MLGCLAERDFFVFFASKLENWALGYTARKHLSMLSCAYIWRVGINTFAILPVLIVRRRYRKRRSCCTSLYTN